MKSAIFAALALAGATAPAFAHPDERLGKVAQFFATADIVAGPEVVDCTLSQGEKTECFSITLAADPQTYTPGPWCPTTISDGAEAGGIWFLDGKTVDVNGEFITQLAEIYGDTNWKLYDSETGHIRYTGTLEECQAAARPDVDPAYQNYCVQCLPETLPEAATVTYVIPFDPVAATDMLPTAATGSGVAYNGVRLDGPAPVDAILGAYTIAPFDDCGGHVNPHVGYHYHAVTDCLDAAPDVAEANGHGAQIGIAMDGQAILPHLMADGSDPVGLDQCKGHTNENGTYHYHVGEAGSNAILGCLTAQAGCALEDPDGVCDASVRRPRP
ncbi:YHYH protein [Sulfitobacter sp. CW3]|uniref:YHYH protein n=1 Tax=Sulfitobacter sp. CW3 TaxID=2861965 RepID=UPI001C5FD941|nr:YHYH protein [Sulfitobacter sp. CW3]MBW4962178.1 YHYH protein [Sulfitobacter sp. CW3]